MASTGTDTGYAFCGPTIVDRTMPLKNGLTLEANHQAGVVVSETAGSPLHHATLFAQGTTVVSADGVKLGDARLCEFTDPEGDSAWAIGLNWPAGTEATFRLVQGTGKWEGIGGLLLSANTQAGVLISENEHSPRHNATCYDRGTTIKTPEGRALGDIMLLEDTDADGDVVWLYHEWWYGQGPGRYRFLGGTGKWAGIAGVGKTLGSVCSRADDHYMPTWEMHWKIKG